MSFRDDLGRFLLMKKQEYEAIYSDLDRKACLSIEKRDEAWREFQASHKALVIFEKEE